MALAEARAEAEAEANEQADTEAHINQVPRVAFVDFVEGKGQGLIVLLQYDYHSYFDFDMLTCM